VGDGILLRTRGPMGVALGQVFLSKQRRGKKTENRERCLIVGEVITPTGTYAVALKARRAGSARSMRPKVGGETNP